MSLETAVSERDELVAIAQSLYLRGYTFGTAGNISARLDDRVVISPTNSSFGDLSVADLAEVNWTGEALPGPKPSKEAHFHLAAYRARPDARAVVHLHSCYATAVSCLEDLDLSDAMPVYTPYYAMRLPCLPVVNYYPPGDAALGPAVEAAAAKSPALLLRNHGSITIGRSLKEASALAEEIEEQAKLYFMLGSHGPLARPVRKRNRCRWSHRENAPLSTGCYGVDIRYPGDLPDLLPGQDTEALELAHLARETVLGQLKTFLAGG